MLNKMLIKRIVREMLSAGYNIEFVEDLLYQTYNLIILISIGWDNDIIVEVY